MAKKRNSVKIVTAGGGGIPPKPKKKPTPKPKGQRR